MSSRTTVRRTATAAAALSAALVLAGCGNSAAPSGGKEVKGDSSSSSSSSSPSPPATSDSQAGAGLTADTIFPTTYAAAMKAGSAHMTMSSSGGQSFKAVGDVTYTGGSPTMQMSMSGFQGVGSGSMQMRYVDKMLYLQIPGMTPAGKFLAIDPSDKNSPMGKAFGQLTGQLDPLKSLQAIKGAVTSVKLVGHDTIDGASTDKYHVVVDTKKALSQLSGSLPSSATAQLPKTLSYDLWLDHQDLMRQMEFTFGGMTLHMELSKWGEPVKVAKPAAGDVVKTPQQQ